MKITRTDLATTSTSRLSSINILLIDADKELSLVLKKVLRSLGFGTIHHARDGSGAIDIVRRNTIDLVITDWDMKPMSGIAFIDFIRNDKFSPDPVLPIIMLTGRSKRINVEEARDHGITEYLVKPFTAKTLCDRITLVIEHPRSFVMTPHYNGPDRRRKHVPYDNKRDRRTKDQRINLINKNAPLQDIAQSDQDVFMIDADFSIREKIGTNISVKDIFSDENVKEAQKIFTQSREEFLDWVVGDLGDLEAAYRQLSTDHTEDDIQAMCLRALTVKSRAGTFGYDLASKVSDSLHDVCFGAPQIDLKRLQIVRKHIDVLYVIFRRNILGSGGVLGRDLLESLSELTARYKTG